MKKEIFITFLILTSEFIFAQSDLIQTTLYLKNKSKLIGNLKSINNGVYELQLKDSEIIMQIPQSEVKRIVQNESYKFRTQAPYEFREKGFYNITSLKVNSGNNIYDQTSFGYGVETVTGYMINKYLGVGVGVGYDYYGEESYKAVIPVFTEARGYLLGKEKAYFYSIAGGYSWGLKDESYSITSAPGGWMFHPALGIRFGAKKHFNTSIDLGVRLQKARWIHEPQNDWLKSSEKQYFYKRFVIRIGIQL
ncbi:MAG: hypothetical protein HOP11_00730 [Saprospiraceae bacterium]|nr:hypothetical protein [Saprospiraceae bacterium]